MTHGRGQQCGVDYGGAWEQGRAMRENWGNSNRTAIKYKKEEKKWYLVVVLICISVVISVEEHLIACSESDLCYVFLSVIPPCTCVNDIHFLS